VVIARGASGWEKGKTGKMEIGGRYSPQFLRRSDGLCMARMGSHGHDKSQGM
jgi:hypothetical protein